MSIESGEVQAIFGSLLSESGYYQMGASARTQLIAVLVGANRTTSWFLALFFDALRRKIEKNIKNNTTF